MPIVDRTPRSLMNRALARTQKSCTVCGQDYSVPTSIAFRYSTCSDECSRTRRRVTKLTGECENCGERMIKRDSLQRFCSNACRLTHLNSLPRKRTPDGVLYGKTVTAKGYIRGMVRQGGAIRWVMEHRWTIEQAIRRRLHPSEAVHHINGDRADNRLENLALYSDGHAAHLRHEHATRKRRHPATSTRSR